MYPRFLISLAAFLILTTPCFAQKKYQSLMWKISGNGMTKPSYMYGTMHISGKMVFHLGDPFYKAIKEVDEVALELEPEAWLQAIFEEKKGNLYNANRGTNEYGFSNNNDIPDLQGFFVMNTNMQKRVQEVLMFDPVLLNYMLFRSGNYGLTPDFEENTWLDMHIYQTGKKLGKSTFGLETYAQSSHFMKMARKEEMDERDETTYDAKDRKERQELLSQLEPAYRNQDLDLIDSLNKKTTTKSFDKYILVERNKVFVQNMDSVMKSGKSIFAGMGCAHLPGSNGVIDMLREMGYTVEPYNKGEHGGKERTKLEKQIFKRTSQVYVSDDKALSFSTPAKVYPLGGDADANTWMSMDIPNGASFLIASMRTYAGWKNYSTQQVLSSIDSILYESVAGSIESKKRITVQGFTGYDILNKTRKGDFHRSMILVQGETILVLRATATGDKIKNGYGEEFFSSLKVNIPTSEANSSWTSTDGSIRLTVPARMIAYSNSNEENSNGDFTATAYDATTQTFYLSQRHTVSDPGFIDEDIYEVNRLADVYKDDNKFKELSRSTTLHQSLPAVRATFQGPHEKKIHALFVLQNLNYCVFTALTNNEQEAEKYFKSIQFKLSEYKTFTSYTDTTCHFKVDLPYVPKSKKSDEEEEFNWYFSSREDEKNIFRGTKEQTQLSAPNNAETVRVHFQRYHRFSDAEDSLSFIQNREEFIKNNNLKVDTRNITWTPTGVIMDHVLSDTSSVRKAWVKQILHNKSLYVLQTTYDSILGPSSFLTTAFRTFEPNDTAFAYNHFINMDMAYLDALYSTDSTIQVNALKMADQIDFGAEAVPRIRTVLHNMPAAEDTEDLMRLKEHLVQALHNDTSAANIVFIKEEYYRNMDSAYYQTDLLNNLRWMKTRNSILAFKQLLLDEPPIVELDQYEWNGMLDIDSLQLAKLLMPEVVNLASLNEYEVPVYDLMATLMDSAMIKSKSIEAEIPQLLMEAKNELKRINAIKTDDDYRNSYMLLNYCSLLHPFRGKSDVAAFFAKAYSTKNTQLLFELVDFDLDHKVAVPDSMLQRIAKKQDLIIPLYEMLYEHKMTERFPEQYRSTEELIKLYIKENYRNRHDKKVVVDSVMIFHKREDKIRTDALMVYYAKYKRSDSKQWKGVIIAFDHKNPNHLWPRRIVSSKTIVLDEHEDEMEEMNLAYKQLVELNRKQRNFGHGYTGDDDYDWY
jgi:uncharacterized protein YbaP (TraB family)